MMIWWNETAKGLRGRNGKGNERVKKREKLSSKPKRKEREGASQPASNLPKHPQLPQHRLGAFPLSHHSSLRLHPLGNDTTSSTSKLLPTLLPPPFPLSVFFFLIIEWLMHYTIVQSLHLLISLYLKSRFYLVTENRKWFAHQWMFKVFFLFSLNV